MNRWAWVVAVSLAVTGCDPKRGRDGRTVLIDLATGRVAMIATRETTVGEYEAFVRWVESTGDHRFCHPAEPAGKDHRPGSVRSRHLADPDAPVVGVDWFDAYAYCAWSGRRLPAPVEWAAAGGHLGSGWIVRPRDAAAEDLETSVSEWCDDGDDGAEAAPVCGGNRHLDERSARRVTRRPRLHRHSSIGFRAAWRIAASELERIRLH